MASLNILMSEDIEDIVRLALNPYFTIYVRPLPEHLEVPCLEVTSVGGNDLNKIDTFDIVLDARATEDAEANELLRKAIGTLKEIAKLQNTAIRAVNVNTSGSWGNDPVRPDLSMYSARLRVTVHQKITTITEVN